MDLTQPLQELVAKVPGAVGAVLIDHEGEAITHFSAADDQERIRLIGAYQRIWLSDCLRLMEEMRMGNLKLMIRRYEAGTVLVKSLPDNLALVLLGDAEMFVGQGIWHLQVAEDVLNEEL